jgi:hypothetical protein
VLIDTEKCFHDINRRLVACNQTLENGMFPQVEDDAREERRELRDLKTWLTRLEEFARASQGEGTGQ